MRQKTINFSIEIKPQPKQSTRLGKNKYGQRVFHTDRKKAKYVNDIKILTLAKTPKNILYGPVSLTLHYEYRHPKSWSKKKVEKLKEGTIFWKDTQPDLHDNLNKPVVDAFQQIFFENDGQISEFKAFKTWALKDQIHVTLKQLEQ